jgi:hypothetical protein
VFGEYSYLGMLKWLCNLLYRINGCVNYGNYKHFFLFVMYVALYCIWTLSTMIPLLYNSIKRSVGPITLAFCWKAYKFYLSCIFYVWWNIAQSVRYRKWIPLLTGVEPLVIVNIERKDSIFNLFISGS